MRRTVIAVLLAPSIALADSPPDWVEAPGVGGAMEKVYLMPDAPCQGGAEACFYWYYCAKDGRCLHNVIAGNASSRHVLAHELDHHAGLQHGPEFRTVHGFCVTITVAGRTKWTVGKWLCRRSDTDEFFEVWP